MNIQVRIINKNDYNSDTDKDWSLPVDIDEFILHPNEIEFEWENGETLPYNDFIFFGEEYYYRLFEILEKLDKCGIKWGLSNVFKNKDYTNEHLIKWCEKNNWHVHHLDLQYASLGKGNANSDEVYICNYNTFEDLM